MKHIQKIICIAVFFTMVFACSTKKDSVINRNYHALTTKFNVLFNGKEAFKIGLNAINETYEDNFWKQLPIEPLAFKEEGLTPIKLRPKEGLAIMNGTAVMTALACQAYDRAGYASKLMTRITALASIGLKGNSHHFDDILFSVKPHPGQQNAARRIQNDLNHHAMLQS